MLCVEGFPLLEQVLVLKTSPRFRGPHSPLLLHMGVSPVVLPEWLNSVASYFEED